MRRSSEAIYVRMYDRPNPRVVRMMAVGRMLGLRPRFIGAKREKDRSRSDMWEGFRVDLIGPSFPLVNGRRLLLYAGAVTLYGIALLWWLIRSRPAVIHVSDFEVYWPARVYSLCTGVPLIYNIHDNLSQRYRVWSAIAKVLNFLEGVAAKAATVTLVPEVFRRDALPAWSRHNVVVVRNAPMDPGCFPPVRGNGSDVVLFVGGWIDEGRGIVALSRLVETSDNMRLRVAGMGDQRTIAELERHPRVEVLGYVTHSEVLRETARADFVCALYDPDRPINRFAASNKIAESLAVGRPLVINRELEVAKVLAPYQCTVEVDYHDHADLAERLTGLRFAHEEYEAMCRRARRAYEDHYAWETVFAAIASVYRRAGFAMPGSAAEPDGRGERRPSATKGIG